MKFSSFYWASVFFFRSRAYYTEILQEYSRLIPVLWMKPQKDYFHFHVAITFSFSFS